MLKKLKLFLILIISTAFILFPQIVNSLNYEQLNRISQEITVLIDGCNSGSGFIYQSQNNIYYVLTTKHIFDNSTVGCLAIAPDQTQYNIDNKDIIIPIPGVDLAVFSFKSDKNYDRATFGNSINAISGKTIYVVGSPAPSAAIPQRTTLFVDGKVVGRQSSQEGYELIYNNPTSPGMSGGAVLNTQGQVIGIHGQGDRIDKEKTGLNLAIPIETFFQADFTNLPEPILKSTISPDESQELVEVNYSTLENQLERSTWKEANDTTVKLMLQSLGREDEGWFSKENLELLPCENLKKIDHLWQKYSNNKFGFSVQKALFTETIVKHGVRDNNIFDKFAETVGWKKAKLFPRNYNEIKYNLNSQKGHLPVLPGVVPLSTITNTPQSIRVIVNEYVGQFILGILTITIGSIVIIIINSICKNIFCNKYYLNDYDKYQGINLINNICCWILFVLVFLKTFNYFSNGVELVQEFMLKQREYIEDVNRNRPIADSVLHAGVKPLVFTLERCNI